MPYGSRDQLKPKLQFPMSDRKTIALELTDDEAWNLALFLKRTSWSTFERHSDPTDKDEPHRFSDAVSATARSLRNAGFAPR
jgi:hypothetical protein